MNTDTAGIRPTAPQAPRFWPIPVALAIVALAIMLASSAQEGFTVAAFFFWIVVIPAIVASGLLPTIIATRRRHRQTLAIIVLNILGGWTGILWVIAVVWACTADVRPR